MRLALVFSAEEAILQIFIDLIVVSLLAIAWMWQDSRQNRRLFWPYAALTLAAGSFGPLLYLLIGAVRQRNLAR